MGLKSIEKNEIICTYVTSVDERIIAKGETGQKILTKEKIARIFEDLKK